MSSKAAARYAKSLIDLSKEQNALESVKDDMVFFEKVVGDHAELNAILKNPIVPLDKKKGIVSGLTQGKCHQVSEAFFALAINKGRSALLFEIAKQFVDQYNQLKGIVQAEVVSAVTLSDAQRQEIAQVVKKAMQANEVVLQEQTNANIIGGFVLKVGDRQFDASIASSLNKLRKELAQTGV